MNQITDQNNLPEIPLKKGFWKKFFSLNNRLFSALIGLIFAGIFCTGIYVLAAYTYNPGDTLDPTSCTGPTDPNCMAPPATYPFGANNFTGTGSFTTSGGTITGSTITDGTLSITGGSLTTTGTVHAGTINVGGAYTFPIIAPTSNGQALIGNTNGTMSWAAPSAGTSAIYVGPTASSYTGSLTSGGGHVGYQAADDICNTDQPGSHMCSVAEILYTLSTNFGSLPSDTEWISNGPPGYTANANDCSGHTSSDHAYLGAFWDFSASAGGGAGYLTNCSVQKKLACCK